MGSIILWLLVGLIAGAIASAIVPGRTPGGTIGAIIVGIVGGLAGGWLLDALDVNENLTWLGSLIVATVGAVIILYAMRATSERSGGREVPWSVAVPVLSLANLGGPTVRAICSIVSPNEQPIAGPTRV